MSVYVPPAELMQSQYVAVTMAMYSSSWPGYVKHQGQKTSHFFLAKRRNFQTFRHTSEELSVLGKYLLFEKRAVHPDL